MSLVERCWMITSKFSVIAILIITGICFGVFVYPYMKKKREAALVSIVYIGIMSVLYLIPQQIGNFSAYMLGVVAAFLCLLEMERKSKDFRGMDDNVAYKNKQIDNVEISNEGRRALREKLREVKPKVEEPIGYELTIQDTNEVEWEHYTSMREYSGLTLKDGKYNLEDVMKSMMDAYETRYNYIVKEHENGERRISYDLTGENSLTLDEDLAGLDRAYNKRLANLAGYIVCQQTNDGSKFFQTTNMKKNTAEQKEYLMYWHRNFDMKV